MESEPVQHVAGEPPLRLSVDGDTTPSTIRLAGDLDAETAPLLGPVVEDQIARGHVDVVVDTAALGFCGVRGLDALLTAQRRLREAGGDLRLRHASPFLLRIVHLCGADDLLEDRLPQGSA